MEKIAILGANESICMLIRKAKEMGYETHVFAWQCGDPGEKEADYFYPISIAEKETILEKCREIGISGICSITSDFAAPVVNFVARNMGLTCNMKESEVLARDKYEMRCALKKAGLFVPDFVKVNQYNMNSVKIENYPVIVKPTDRWSSKGVNKVDSQKWLVSAIKTAINESFSKEAIVESFIDGNEYSAAGICYNGKSKVLSFTQKETTGFPHFVEKKYIQPSDILPQYQKKYEDTICKAVECLGIKNGAFSVDFLIMDSNEIAIIEIGARMGGDFIGTDLVINSTGFDYVGMVIDIACGKAPSFKKKSNPDKTYVQFIIDENDIDDYNRLLISSPESIIRKSDFDYDFDREVIDSSTRHGYYIVKNNDYISNEQNNEHKIKECSKKHNHKWHENQ